MTNSFHIKGNRSTLEPIGPNGTIPIATDTNYKGFVWDYLDANTLRPSLTFSFSPLIEFVTVGGTVTNPQFSININKPHTSFTVSYIDAGAGNGSQNPAIVSNVFTVTGAFTSFSTVGNGAFFNAVVISTGVNSAETGSLSLFMQAANYQFWGSATGFDLNQNTISESFIKGLSNSGLAPYPSGIFEFSNMPSGTCAWYATREDGEQPLFRDLNNNIYGGFRLIASGVSLTNNEGHIEDYRVWRSENDNLGTIKIEVTGTY